MGIQSIVCDPQVIVATMCESAIQWSKGKKRFNNTIGWNFKGEPTVKLKIVVQLLVGWLNSMSAVEKVCKECGSAIKYGCPNCIKENYQISVFIISHDMGISENIAASIGKGAEVQGFTGKIKFCYYATSDAMPTLEEISHLDVVIMETFGGVYRGLGHAFGDLIADFCDQGGGFVSLAATNCLEWGTDCVLNGRFEKEKYHPLEYTTTYCYEHKLPPHLGVVFEMDHPLLVNVKRVHTGVWTGHSICTVAQGAKLIANWCDSQPMFAEKSNPKTQLSVALALNCGGPNAQYDSSNYWSYEESDLHVVLFNAVRYVKKGNVKRDWRKRLLSEKNLVFTDVSIYCEI